VDEGVVEPLGRNPACWRFRGISIRRVRCALRLERDLGVNVAGAALALDLLDEIEVMRSRLRRYDD
jgi:chaperone modulatory protein CbpM